MTFFHCRQCRRHIRLDHHARTVVCVSCQTTMLRGRGRRTRPAPRGYRTREHGRRNRARDRYEALT